MEYGTTHIMAFNGNFGYSRSGGSELYVFDLTNPAYPTLAYTYYSGPLCVIDVSDGLACVGTDRGFETLSLANPVAPARLGYDFFPFMRDGQGISPVIDGDKLYLGWGVRPRQTYDADVSGGGVMVYSIADPADPQLLAHFESATTTVYDIEVANGYAYVTGSNFLVMQYTPGTGEGEGEEVGEGEGESEGEGEGEGEAEFVLYSRGVGIFDNIFRAALGMGPDESITRSDLETITRIDPLPVGTPMQTITPVRYCKNLEVFNATNQNVDDLSYLANLSRLKEVYLANNQVKTIRGLVDNPAFGPGCVLDIRNNPLTEESLCLFVPELRARGVQVICEKICGQGTPAWRPNHHFKVLGRYYADVLIERVAAQGNIACVGGGSGELHKNNQALQCLDIVDVSQPTHPVRLSSTVVPQGIEDISIQGDYVYVARMGGFDVVDISDPYHPQFVHYPLPLRIGLHTTDLLPVGNTLWVTSSDSLFSVDITDPAHARYLGPYSFVAPRTAKFKNYLYALRPDCFDILDTAILEYPVFLGSAMHGSTPNGSGGNRDMVLHDDYAITLRTSRWAFSGGAFEVFDVSDPRAPHFVKGWPFYFGDPTFMTILDDTIFFANNSSGVYAVDISDSQDLTWIGVYCGESGGAHARGTIAWDVAALSGGTCYIAEHNFLTIAQFTHNSSWPDSEGDFQFSIPPYGGAHEVGDDVTLGFDFANAYGPVSFQWFRDGVAIPGATDQTLNLPFVQPEDAGRYVCAVTDQQGFYVSPIAHVRVSPEPLPVSNPIVLVVLTGLFLVITGCFLYSARRNA